MLEDLLEIFFLCFFQMLQRPPALYFEKRPPIALTLLLVKLKYLHILPKQQYPQSFTELLIPPNETHY